VTLSPIGGRAAFISMISASAVVAASPASAQIAGPTADPIAQCRDNNATDQGERIACLETAIRKLMGDEGARAGKASESAPDTAVARNDGREDLPDEGETDPPPAEQVAAADDGAGKENATPDTAEAQPTGLGAEQVIARNRSSGSDDDGDEKEVETQTAKVVDFAVTRNKKYVFFLENGQIWRQKSSDDNPARLFGSRDYTAEVKRGAVSGYRLSVSGVKRPFLVERLK